MKETTDILSKIENFFKVFASSRMLVKSKHDQFLVEKKTLHECCPSAIRTAFSSKYLLDAKVQNCDF